MSLIAKATSLVGGAVAAMRRKDSPHQQAMGANPNIPDAKKQGIMTLKMPVAEGWRNGRLPTCADGLQVNVFASKLDHPRWIEVLPNGDVLVAESKEQPGPPKTIHAVAEGGSDISAPINSTVTYEFDGGLKYVWYDGQKGAKSLAAAQRRIAHRLP